MSANYYPINEDLARRAKEMNSFSDYVPGSAIQSYRAEVDEAAALAERQKQRVDPIHHDKIDSLLDAFARKLADNINRRNEIATCQRRCDFVVFRRTGYVEKWRVMVYSLCIIILAVFVRQA